MKTTALLFDMDGVLVDVSSSYRRAIIETAKRFLEKRGIEARFTDDDVQKIKNQGDAGNDWIVTQRLIKTIYDGPDVSIGRVGEDEIKTAFQTLYLGSAKFEESYGITAPFSAEGYILNEKWLLPLDLLEALERDKWPLGIVSGRPRKELDYALKIAGARMYFPVTVAMEDVEKGKPSAEGITKALELLNCKQGYYFGDTIDDMIAATRAGLTGIGSLPPGAGNPAELELLLKRNGAKKVIGKIDELYEAIG